MATGSITTLGIGSSLDVQGILDGLRKADEASITTKETEITTLQATHDEYNVLNGMLLQMKSSASSLSLSSNFLSRSVSISSDAVTVSSSDGVTTGTYETTVDRLASKSSFTSSGKAASTNTVYVPTDLKSTQGFSTRDSEIVLAEDEEMTITYGTGDDIQTITITGGAGGYTLDQLAAAIDGDAANGGASTYVDATVYTGEDGDFYLQIAASSGGSGETNRVNITEYPDSTGFSADPATFSYQLGSTLVSLDINADTSLADLATQINEDTDNPGVTASVVNTGIGQTPYQLVLKANSSGEDNRITIAQGLDDLTLTEGQGAGYVMTSESSLSFSGGPIVIRQADSNTDIIFQEDAGSGYTSEITATIADGVYTSGSELAAAVETALEEASLADGNGIDYTVSWNSDAGKLEIKESDGSLTNLNFIWGDAGSTAGSDLGFSTTQVLTPAASSLNASLTVDGIAYQRQSNSNITDLVSGMSLSLAETGSANISVTEDTEDIKTNITAIVTLMNDIITEIDANDDYDEDTDTWGTLAKESSVQTMESTLRSLLQTEVDTGGSIDSLWDLGFEINADGSISINETTLDAALASNFDDVQAYFIGDDDTTGMGDLLNAHLLDLTKLGGYIESETGALDVRMDNLEETIENETARIEKKYETMTQQFVEMDRYMREMESMQSYVSEIFSATKQKDE